MHKLLCKDFTIENKLNYSKILENQHLKNSTC